MSDALLFGAVEAGGTKFVCAVGSGPGDLRCKTTLPTENPDKTLSQVVEFFHSATEQHGPLASIGVGSFGPVDVHSDSSTFGHITATPKPHWSHVDVVGTLRQAFPVPFGFDTDVNAAALGETLWGAGQGASVVIYMTVGTGIGAGVLHNGELLHGLVHPEMGHQRIPHDRDRDPYAGHCPFHGDCLEGLASGAAMTDRWGKPGSELGDDHPAWELEAEYLALGITNMTLLLSPQRVIVGGGVMKQPGLIDSVRTHTLRLLADYVKHPLMQSDLSRFVVPPGLGDESGILGALALAQQAHRRG